MAKNTLPEDFKDDILAESMNGRRRYQMISNADGTVSFVDVTEYSQVGSNFGQAQINATNVAVNESADKNKIIDSKEDLLANTQAGMMAGALAVKEIRSELNEKLRHSLHFGISNQTNYVTVNLSEIPRGVYLLFNTSSGGFNGWILVNYDNKNIFSLDNKDVNSDSTINDGVLMLNCGTWYSDIWGFCFS